MGAKWAPCQHCEMEIFAIENFDEYSKAVADGKPVRSFLVDIHAEPERAVRIWETTVGKNIPWQDTVVRISSAGIEMLGTAVWFDGPDELFSAIVPVIDEYLSTGSSAASVYGMPSDVSLSAIGGGAAELCLGEKEGFIINPSLFLLDMVKEIDRYLEWKALRLGRHTVGYEDISVKDLLVRLEEACGLRS